MRNALVTISCLLFLSFVATGQTTEIQSVNGVEFCRGYGPNHMAQFQITGTFPFQVPPGTAVVYTWTAQHPNGTKVWNTNFPYRAVPIPWVGEYIVQVKVEYIRKGNSRPFITFWSNQVVVRGIECNPLQD